ncbi:MAG: outer membrane lipoprotein chaperone LolA [Methylococcales bacterium]|jgi:outer membrane lipoprotein carrier protein|nr:outer membrane lipoprotein chaperone LolA [Methylococcales bacterium]MBT7410929.1 outer membrane lipoprotein chaperone LolA [Methylococcales bacterium]
MNKPQRLILTLFLLLSPWQLLFAEMSVLEHLQTLLNQLKTYQTDFEQVITNSEHSVIEKSKGKFTVKRPGKFFWQYTSPYEQKIIADGETLFIYDIDLDQVTLKNQTGVLHGTPASLLSYQSPVKQNFIVDLESKQGNNYWISLKPKKEESGFEKLMLTFSKDKLIEMDILDQLGQMTHFKFTNIINNPEIGDAFFQIKIPEGVDVLDARTKL